MKYTAGMWKLKAGFSVDWVNHVERLRVEENDVHLTLAKLQRHRGDTLNTATITSKISSPLEGVIGVKFTHWAGTLDQGPDFDLTKTDHKVTIAEKKAEKLTYESGALKLIVNSTPNELGYEFRDPKGKVTGHSFRSIGYVKDATTSKSDFNDGIYFEEEGHVLAALDLGVGEKIYGLGERFGPFVKNGQSIEVWNEDGGSSSELAYKNVPFFLSSRGYGVFINHPGKVELEVQSERTTRINISVAGEELEYFVIYGQNPKDVLKRYTALTGKPSLPPAWSYNLWLTTSFTTNYSEETVTGFLDGFKERDIPLGVFHFDCFWMKSFQWCDFEFDTEMFPDAPGYLKRLKERGLKLCVWINPYIGQASPLFAEGKREGYFIKRTNGSVWQWDNWQAGMAIVDFTNPAACTWYTSHLKRLLSMGIDSFKTDFAERIPFKNVTYHDGSDPVRMHNYYSHLYNSIVWKTLVDATPESAGPQACLFARSGTAGSQQFPVHWGGDCESTFEAMAESLRGGLSLGLSGFGFWAHDIGGFEGTPPASLYKRWVQFGLFSSHSRLHGSSSFRVPWIYGEDCSDVLRQCVKRKISLTPYLLQQALVANRDGTPMMRAMFLEFPEDLSTYTLDTQYMLGSDLLVAPIFNEEGTVTFYVPQTGPSDAKWRSAFFPERTYEPGTWVTETHDFSTLPVLVRPGAVIPINTKIANTQADLLDGLQIVVNGPLKDAAEQKLEIVDAVRADKVVKVITVKADTVEVDGEQPALLQLRNKEWSLL